MVTSFGLCRLSSGQNIYKNLNAGIYRVLFRQCHGIPFTIPWHWRTIHCIQKTLSPWYCTHSLHTRLQV